MWSCSECCERRPHEGNRLWVPIFFFCITAFFEKSTKTIRVDMSILAYIAASVATVGVTVPPVIERASVNWTDADWPAELGVLTAL